MNLNFYENYTPYLRTRYAAWVVNIIGVIFISTATSLQADFYTDGFGDFADGLQLAPLVYSLLWSSITIGLVLAGKRYHPGIDVAFDLIGILMGCGTVWLLIDWTATIGDYYQGCYDDDCTRTKARTLKASEVIGVISVLISIIIHIAFFYQACVAVHKLNTRSREDRKSLDGLAQDIEAAKQ